MAGAWAGVTVWVYEPAGVEGGVLVAWVVVGWGGGCAGSLGVVVLGYEAWVSLVGACWEGGS